MKRSWFTDFGRLPGGAAPSLGVADEYSSVPEVASAGSAIPVSCRRHTACDQGPTRVRAHFELVSRPATAGVVRHGLKKLISVLLQSGGSDDDEIVGEARSEVGLLALLFRSQDEPLILVNSSTVLAFEYSSICTMSLLSGLSPNTLNCMTLPGQIRQRQGTQRVVTHASPSQYLGTP